MIWGVWCTQPAGDIRNLAGCAARYACVSRAYRPAMRGRCIEGSAVTAALTRGETVQLIGFGDVDSRGRHGRIGPTSASFRR